MKEMTKYKGIFMLFGLFRIRKDYALFQETDGSPYTENSDAIKKLEPWMQRWCTIKWVDFDENDPQPCYFY